MQTGSAVSHNTSMHPAWHGSAVSVDVAEKDDDGDHTVDHAEDNREATEPASDVDCDVWDESGD